MQIVKTWKPLNFLLLLAVWLACTISFTAPAATLPKVTNVSPNPALTNEFYITATNIVTSFNGTNVHVLVYMDDPPGGGGAPRGIPGPLVEANVGQVIICHFRNNLSNNIEGASIHWHGIELDNDSDGTAVVEDTILPGQTYTYRFIVTRAGLFWYHSHMIPGTTTYGGMYGPIIVHDTNETTLIASNVLPSAGYTFPLVMSDISFTNGFVGKVINGTNYSINTLIQLCENSILGVPNADNSVCPPTGKPGDLFLCNGKIPSLVGGFCTPTASSSPVYFIGKSQRIRLQLFNASSSRTVNLSLHYPCASSVSNTNLYHIGGQGGFLDHAVLDGGLQSGYDFIFPQGTINLGSGMREDVMFYSAGNNGDVIQLMGSALPVPWKLDTAGLVPTNYPIAFFVVTNGGATNLPLTTSSPILTAVGGQNENLKLLATNSLAVPPYPTYGSQTGVVQLIISPPNNRVSGNIQGPNIGNYAATALDGNSGFGSWPYVPHPPTALWAHAGDVLQLTVANLSTSVHPYHLHGFAMQPVAIYSSDLQTNLFNYPFNEFVDTIDIYPGEALVFRIKLTDRPILADSATGGPYTTAVSAPTGGNLGRWLMHCHIFLHGTIGMISELVVIPNTVTRLVSASPGTNSVITTAGTGVPWTLTPNVSWLHAAPGYSSGTGGTTVLFTYDTNSGPARVGTLNIGGETVQVTQAGTNYVQAGPLTSLVPSSVSNPFGIGVDSSGNVCFADSGNSAVKRWSRSLNSTATLASGLSSPYGLAVDSLDNVYFGQFGSTLIRKYSDATGISTVFANDTTGVAGVAVDNAGKVYIAVPGEHAVKQWDGSSLNNYTTNGLISPWGVAVDSLGGLYTSDIGDNTIKKYGFTVIFFLGHPIFIPYWNTLTAITNLNSPYNLAVDNGGNIFVADYLNGAIKKWSAASNTVTTVVSGLGNPTGVAEDGTGNVFVSDWGSDVVRELPYAFVNATPRQEPAELTVDKLPGILMPNEDLLPPFAPIPNQPWIFYGGSTTGAVQFLVTANAGGPRSGTITVLGQPVAINQDGQSWKLAITNVLVGPAAGSNTVTELVIPTIAAWSASTPTPWLHLPLAGGTGSGNILFTYDQNFGLTRAGTINLNGQVLTVTQAGATYVPAPAPATPLVSFGLGVGSPVDVAPDPFGNVIFADSENGTVNLWTPGTTNSSIIFSGIYPQGVAVDPSGNIYAADYTSQSIVKWRAADSNVVTLVSAAAAPEGISLGSGTNIYWGSPATQTVNEWIASASNSMVIISNGLSQPYGVAVDIAGNIYIADTGANAIKKWDPVASSLTTIATTGVSSPWNVGVDGCGNVYVANGSGNNILEWVAASGKLIPIVPGGLTVPTDVKSDANQNIFIADFGGGAVKELPHAFVDATTRSEPAIAGGDTLLPVLPPNQNLAASFAPVSSDPWLTITNISGGVVSFKFTANPTTSLRTAHITVLGQNVTVNQAGAVVPVFSAISMLTNGVFQLSLTNGMAGGSYSVLFTTNLLVPYTNWIVIGTASNNGANIWQFTDFGASNNTRFYRIRTP